MWIVLAAACGGGDDPGERAPGDGCAPEVPYDGIDQDCADGDLVDVDRDGWDALAVGGPDCDDADPSVHPQADEVPYDGIDQDCAAGDLVDVDRDDHPHPDDCDDADPSVHPDALDEVGDAVDRNCDGLDGEDDDGDGFASPESGGDDCDDQAADRHPGAAEVWYDGIDQDCDRACDWDQDGDGAVAPGAPPVDDGPCDADPEPGLLLVEDCADTDPAAATQQPTVHFPEPGSANAGPGTFVQVVLSGADPTATLTLADAGGAAVAGTSTVADAVVTFVPDAPLAAGALYTAELDWGCGVESWSFRVAVPIEDPTTLLDRVYAFDLSVGTWVEPVAVGPLLASLFVDARLFLAVTGAGADTLDVLFAPGDPGGQDVCVETTAVAGASFAGNPSVAIGPADVTIDLFGYYAPVHDFVLLGTFAADGTSIDEVTIAGAVDTRPMVDLIAPGGGDDAICQLVATFGVACEACRDGSGDFCLPHRIEDLVGAEVGGALVPRDAAAIANDPACDP